MCFKKRSRGKHIEEYLQNKKWKRVHQVGYDRKKKRPIYEELTYDYFANNLGEELMFDCQMLRKTISIAVSSSYEFGVMDWETNCWEVQYFDSPEELLANARIEGKTIKEIWDELEN